MQPFDRYAPLISIHIPKAGGTSFQNILESWFPLGQNLFLHYRENQALPLPVPAEGPVVIHGMFNKLRGIGIKDYYPHVTQFVTFLREPFDRFLSQWHYLKNIQKLPVPALQNFDHWIHVRAAERVKSFSFIHHMPEDMDADNAEHIFQQYFIFVGIMERYQDSIAALSRLLGKQAPDAVPHLNRLSRENYAFDRYRDFYREKFAEEYKIYDIACKLNKISIDSVG